MCRKALVVATGGLFNDKLIILKSPSLLFTNESSALCCANRQRGTHYSTSGGAGNNFASCVALKCNGVDITILMFSYSP
jgi:hypothetical protein